MNYKNAKYNENGTIDCEIEHPDYGWIPTTASLNDSETAELFNRAKSTASEYIPPPPPTATELLNEFKRLATIAVQNHLDNTAKSYGYDDINATAKYLRPSSQFYNECVALGDWCDSVWAHCFQLMTDVESGVITQPTIDEIISGLPLYSGV